MNTDIYSHAETYGLPRTLDGLKRTAKRVKRDEDVTHTQALDIVARRMGYENYTHARKTLK